MTTPATTSTSVVPTRRSEDRRPRRAWERSVVGCFFVMMAGVHLGLVAADPGVYQHFADQALFGFVRSGWREVFMADPAFWGLCVMAGELVLGGLLLAGGRAARVGWAGVLVFQVLLMLFGPGFWLWSLPAIALLLFLARRDLAKTTSGSS